MFETRSPDGFIDSRNISDLDRPESECFDIPEVIDHPFLIPSFHRTCCRDEYNSRCFWSCIHEFEECLCYGWIRDTIRGEEEFHGFEGEPYFL